MKIVFVLFGLYKVDWGVEVVFILVVCEFVKGGDEVMLFGGGG